MPDSDFDIHVLVASGPAEDELEEIVGVEGADAQPQALWRKKKATSATGQQVVVKASVLSEQITALAGTLKASLDKLEGDKTAAGADGAGHLRLDSLTVGLSVNASGKVMLVAEVGAEASIELVFKRQR